MLARGIRAGEIKVGHACSKAAAAAETWEQCFEEHEWHVAHRWEGADDEPEAAEDVEHAVAPPSAPSVLSSHSCEAEPPAAPSRPRHWGPPAPICKDV